MPKALVIGLLLLIGVACRDGSPDVRPGQTKPPVVDATNHPATLSIKVTGAFTLQYDGPGTIQVVVPDLGLQPQLRLFSVALAQPVTIRNTKLRAGLNLFGYTGDGKATIPPTAASPAPGGVPSIAYAEMAPATGGGSPAKFTRVSKACTVETALRGRSGRLVCPSLQSDAETRAIALTMSWTAQ